MNYAIVLRHEKTTSSYEPHDFSFEEELAEQKS